MRILLVNKYYYLRSGTERYLFNLKRLLEARGHVVEAFAMQHLRNEPATYAADFAPGVDYRALSGAARLAAAFGRKEGRLCPRQNPNGFRWVTRCRQAPRRRACLSGESCAR